MQINLADEEPRQPATGHNEKRNHTKSRARTSPNSRQIVRPFIAGDCYFLMVEPNNLCPVRQIATVEGEVVSVL
jgi:hypothetical protein